MWITQVMRLTEGLFRGGVVMCGGPAVNWLVRTGLREAALFMRHVVSCAWRRVPCMKILEDNQGCVQLAQKYLRSM